MESRSTISDRGSIRWITLCIGTRWVDLIPIGTESQISQIKHNWISFLAIKHLIDIAQDDLTIWDMTWPFEIWLEHLSDSILCQRYDLTIWDDHWHRMESSDTDRDSSQIFVIYWLILTLTHSTILITSIWIRMCLDILTIPFNFRFRTQFH
jgi:hypothetical protein